MFDWYFKKEFIDSNYVFWISLIIILIIIIATVILVRKVLKNKNVSK